MMASRLLDAAGFQWAGPIGAQTLFHAFLSLCRLASKAHLLLLLLLLCLCIRNEIAYSLLFSSSFAREKKRRNRRGCSSSRPIGTRLFIRLGSMAPPLWLAATNSLSNTHSLLPRFHITASLPYANSTSSIVATAMRLWVGVEGGRSCGEWPPGGGGSSSGVVVVVDLLDAAG